MIIKLTQFKRNQPCHCGSGKKWKKCHGTPAARSAENQVPADTVRICGVTLPLALGESAVELEAVPAAAGECH